MSTSLPSTRVAWVTFDSPNRNGGGGNIRQAYLFEALARRASVDLFTSDGEADEATTCLAARIVRIAPARRWPSGLLKRRVVDVWTALVGGPPELWSARPALRELERLLQANGPYGLVVVEHPGLIPLARRRSLGGAWAFTLHNVGSERARQQATAQVGRRQVWLSHRESALALRNEARAVDLFDSIIAVSHSDAAIFAGPSTVVPNGVDVLRFVVTPLPAEPRVVLTGTLGYLPNVDGIRWFVREVWPAVRRSVPSAELTLVGKAPVQTILALDGQAGIRVVADVPDIEPYLREARVAIVPLRIGSGTRLKALDAMAAGRPVIGTSIGLEGLEICDGEQALIADDPAAFAAGLVRLLQDDALAERLTVAGRAFVETEHDWTEIGGQFADHLLGLTS